MACTYRPDALRLLFCTVLISTLASLAAPAMAQWKWRDADGRVQYSDRPPPPGIPARDVLSRPAAAPPASTQPRNAPATDPAASAATAASASETSGTRNVDPELAARKRAAEAAERKADEERQARERQANCSRARDYQRALENGVPLARVNERGERETVPAAERDAELRRAREVVASDCR
ncbi:DUF4124 domain-containing protein [Leptothrix sp. BB-4]